MANPLASLLPQGILQFCDSNGDPLAGGTVTYYQPNTTVLKTIWADPGEAVALQNPLPLDSAGRPQSGSSEVEVYGSGQYSMLVKDAFGDIVYGPVLTQDVIGLIEELSATGVSGVANMAALRALTTEPQLVWLEGYYQGADGGEGMFWLAQGDTTSVDNGGTVIVTAGGLRYYRETQGELFSIEWFGAKCDGVTDDTFAIQAAINAGPGIRCPSKKGSVTSAPLTITKSGFKWQGDGLVPHILPAFASGDVIQVGSATTNPGNVLIDTLYILCNATGVNKRTNGSGVSFTNCHASRLTNFISFYDNNGVLFEGGAQQFECTLDNFEINACNNAGIIVGAQFEVQDCWIERGVVAGCQNGIEYVYLSGGHLNRVDVINCVNSSVFLVPGTGQVVTALFCVDVEADTTTAGSGWIIGGSGQISNIVCSTCWGCSNKIFGWQFTNPNVDGVTLSGCVAMNNQQHGIAIGAGTSVMVCGGTQVFCNSQSQVNVFDGIAVANGVVGFSITDCFIGLGGSVGFLAPNAQAYGINIGTGCFSYIVQGNFLLNNQTAGMLDASRAGVVNSNVGYVTKSAGQAQVANGTTSVVVPHGLAGQPAPGNIALTPASLWGNAGQFYISNVTPTTFTISTSGNPGEAIFYNWQAWLDGTG